MTELMIELTEQLTSGTAQLTTIATSLLSTLIIIDLIWSVMSNLEQDYLSTLPLKIFKYGVWIWIVTQYDSDILKPVTAFFVGIGAAAGGSAADVSVLQDPSAIIDAGIEAMQPLTDNAFNSISTTIANWILYIFGLAGYVIVAFQVFLTVLEYHVITALAVVLLPFGVLPKTAFLAEKAISAILGFCIKLMVLAFLASVCVPILYQFQLNHSTIGNIVIHIVKVLAIAYLILRGPSVAAGMLSGSPSLSGEGAAQAAAGKGFSAAGSAVSEAGKWTGASNAVSAASSSYRNLRSASSAMVTGGVSASLKMVKNLFK